MSIIFHITNQFLINTIYHFWDFFRHYDIIDVDNSLRKKKKKIKGKNEVYEVKRKEMKDE